MADRVRSCVLVADNDSQSRSLIATELESAGFAAAQCSTMADAQSRLEGFAYDGLVVDVRLADGDGLDLLDEALSRYPNMRCVVTASFGSIHHAVRALKRGAADFLIKPAGAAQVIEALRGPASERAAARPAAPPAPVAPALRETSRETQARDVSARDKTAHKAAMRRVVGSSPLVRKLLHTVQLVAPMQTSVLLQGETGTGKELIARTIHENSNRRDQPFIAFNAAAIPEGLAESELFGHVKGAFTGAIQTRAGRFEEADGGTLFIDEVSSMPMILQKKLLRALQEREIEKVGMSRPTKVDVRIIAASNVDLRDMVKAGTFREDLYYRLNVVRLELPPLRSRPEDIPALAHHFLEESCRVNGVAPRVLSQGALRMLMGFAWPGNVRHLQNAIEHAVALSGESVEITEEMLPSDLLEEATHTTVPTLTAVPAPANVHRFTLPHMPEEGINFSTTMSQLERELILRYLEKAGGNKRRAARLLNLSRTTFIDKLQRLGVADQERADAAAESSAA